jgi:hypothetical protein
LPIAIACQFDKILYDLLGSIKVTIDFCHAFPLARHRIDAEREAVLDVLAARDLAPAQDDRQRILDCADFDQLKTWHRKAVTVTEVSDLFS